MVSTGTIYEVDKSNVDGGWNICIDTASGRRPIEFLAIAPNSHLNISENTTALPNIVNSSDTDGIFILEPQTDAAYTDLDFGFVKKIAMFSNQVTTLGAGQIAILQYQYLATNDNEIVFSLTKNAQTSLGGAFLTGPVSAVDDEQICLLVRVVSSPATTVSIFIANTGQITGGNSCGLSFIKKPVMPQHPHAMLRQVAALFSLIQGCQAMC